MSRILLFTLLFLLHGWLVSGQVISWEYLSPVPEPITNQAVAAARVGDTTFVYTFTGLDSTLSCDGDHRRVYAYNTVTDTWRALADIEDPIGGKIAAAANTIKGKVYVVGGYHLSPACDEVSSAKIHRFDPQQQAFLTDGQDIPVAIDDQVQAVWRDSLLYVVTGWSNTTNVANVQVYNPTDDEWQQANALPNATTYRVFGASGVIIGDTIYYAGGARIGFSFPATTSFRKGAINPANPLDISWSTEVNVRAQGYRMAAGVFNGQAIWFGGSAITYNFDALAYRNNAVVPPLDRILRYDPATGQLDDLLGFIPAVMDFRGLAELGGGEYVLVGGILDDRVVTDQVLKVTISDLTNTGQLGTYTPVSMWPNPTNAKVSLQWDPATRELEHCRLLNVQGQVLPISASSLGKLSLDLTAYPAGTYWVQLFWRDGGGCSVAVQKE